MKPPPEILPAEALSRLAEVGEAEIVVGIPSYNNARTISHVVRAVQAGLARFFPQRRSLIVNSDGGSRDGTADVVRNSSLQDTELLLLAHPLYPIQRLSTPYHGPPGKGSALRCIFRVAERAGARACAVVDADLRSISPDWMYMLLAPILERNFDYVAPLYSRHKYDGTITNSIVYPMTRALYGQRVRQPIGGDFGFSGRLASHYLAQPVWETNVARFGIDIWMTTTAICDGFSICQGFLGAKLHDAKDPGSDLSDMLVQVVGSVFQLMETHAPTWRKIQESQAVPLLGLRFDVGVDPVQVDVERMINRFRQGAKDLRELWQPVLAPDQFAGLEKLSAVASSAFHLPDALWVRLIYDFAVAYHRRVMDRDQLVRSMLPLYMGRVASFICEVVHSDAAQVEERIEQLCLTFESEKPYLLSRWEHDAPAAAPQASEPQAAAEPQPEGQAAAH
jgi:hypothetical protein